MANQEQLEILEKGVECWNAWRCNHSTESIDLNNAFLVDAVLDSASLRGADLNRANLSGAHLNHASLSGASLSGANLIGADLTCADLVDANLSGAKLSDATLVAAGLVGAKLVGTDLNGANLSRANLISAHLIGTALTKTNLTGVILGSGRNGSAIFADVNLCEVIGLETIEHTGPSTVGIDTLYKSRGQIPDKFLRDAGVPEEAIDLARSIRCGPPIQWESCFISYSTKDDEFARRLHARMREANMRVWFAPEDLKGGKKLHEQLFEAIQLNDRLLLVLSAHSIRSEWVITEIRKARAQEKKENRHKLFPIRLTDYETLREWTCFDADSGKDLAVEVREYYIPDFSNWKNHDAFEAEFAKLQRALQDEAAKRLKKAE
jgi:hypothetical protein